METIPETLVVDENKTKVQKTNCYCGKDRNLNIIEVACGNCLKFFHESCIGYQMGKLLPFSMNYIFICKFCSPSGLETYRRIQATLPQMCVTAISNLQRKAIKDGNPRISFSHKEIVPFIDLYWESITTLPRKQTNTWYASIQKTLSNHSNIFSFEDNGTDQLFGLVVNDLTLIKPNYEALIKGGTLKMNEDGLVGSQNSSKAGRQPKRKLPGSGEQNTGPTGKKGRPNSDLGSVVKLPAHGYPMEHPFNKDGYRYILAEPDPHAPFRQEFDESSDWAGKPIPGWLYRVLTPNSLLIALHDRAPQIKVSEDRLSITGEKGYCMARCTHFVTRGSWYWEATIEDMPDGAATRMGWGQEYANLQSPLGYDKFGYSWRSRKGTKFHESHGKHYSDGYGEGDTLGFLIVLPEQDVSKYTPNTYKDRPLVKFKSHLYYEDKDKVSDTLKNLKVHPMSQIYFFKNGKCQGLAFENIYSGAYYPSISIHKGATVSLNFGASVKYPEILKEYTCNTMQERVEAFICEQTMADMFYFCENDGKLRL